MSVTNGCPGHFAVKGQTNATLVLRDSMPFLEGGGVCCTNSENSTDVYEHPRIRIS